MRALRSTLLFAWLLVSGPALVHAQTPSSALDRNTEAVRAGRRGLEAFRLHDWPGAYQAFYDAEALAHSPVFLLYMARARERQGAQAEALDLYTRVAAEPVTKSTPDAWKTALHQASLEADELRTRIAAAAARRARADAARRNEASDPKRLPKHESASNPRRNAAIAASIVGAAGLALGATAGIVAWRKLDSLEAGCRRTGCTPEQRAELDTVETWARLSDIGFVVAGTGLTAAGVFMWLVPASPAGRRAPISAGLSTHWKF